MRSLFSPASWACVGFARFLRVYRAGTGDYTEDRHQWLDGLTVKDILGDRRPDSKKAL